MLRVGTIGRVGRLGLVAGLRSSFSPAALFAAGEVGFWGEVSPLLLWQDAARTTPVTAPNQPIGSWLLNTAAGPFYAAQSNNILRPTYTVDGAGRGRITFNGVDQFLQTPTITPNTDKAQVFAGVRKLSDAATGMLIEHSADVNSNAGSFYLTAPENTVTARYASVGRGSAASTASLRADATTGAAPDTAVITATHDIAGDLSAIRRNGVAGTSATGDKGTGNFLAYPLFIGRRGGASLPFNGDLYGLIVRFGPNLSADQITATEAWVNARTGAY